MGHGPCLFMNMIIINLASRDVFYDENWQTLHVFKSWECFEKICELFEKRLVFKKKFTFMKRIWEFKEKVGIF